MFLDLDPGPADGPASILISLQIQTCVGAFASCQLSADNLPRHSSHLISYFQDGKKKRKRLPVDVTNGRSWSDTTLSLADHNVPRRKDGKFLLPSTLKDDPAMLMKYKLIIGSIVKAS